MQKLFLDKETDRDFSELKSKKWTLITRLFFRILKNNPILSFLGYLLPIFVVIVNYNFNNSITKQFRNSSGSSDEIVEKTVEEIATRLKENPQLVENLNGTIEINKEPREDFAKKDHSLLVNEIKKSLKESKQLTHSVNKKFLDFKFRIPFVKLIEQDKSKSCNVYSFIVKVVAPLLFAKAFFSISHIYLNNYFSWKVENDLKMDFFRHFIDARYESSSKVAPKIFTQFSSSMEGIAEQIWQIPNRIFYVVLSVLMTYNYELETQSAFFYFLFTATFFLTFFLLYFFLKKSTSEYTKSRRRNEENINFAFERVRNLSHVKLSSSEELEKAKLESKLEKTFSENRSTINLIALLQGVPQYFLIPAIPFFLSAILVIHTTGMAFETFLNQFLAYRSLCNEFEKLINSIVRIDGMMGEFNIVNESIFELDGNKKINNSDPIKASINGDITLENISFSYPLRPNVKVIENLNFEFISGKKYGIAGKNGAGKSTITKLILKLFDVSEGRILISGIDVKKIENNSLHSQTCRLTNNPSFFNMSILENVFYPHYVPCNDPIQKKRDLEILWESARKVKIDAFISSLPHGFDTIIRETGSDLSEGQKQQIEAMKVFVRPYEIYMFDEILSNVHPQTREDILKNIFEEINGKTVLVIDHHYDIFRYMDEIYNFSKSELKNVSLGNLDKASEGDEISEE